MAHDAVLARPVRGEPGQALLSHPVGREPGRDQLARSPSVRQVPGQESELVEELGLLLRCWVRRRIPLAGITLEEDGVGTAFGLAVEVLRRRSPPSWGWGRWTRSLACLGVFMNFTGETVQRLIYWLTHPASPHQPPGFFYHLIGGWPDWFSNTILLTLVPALITARVAGVSVGSSPDGREWAGRAFGLLSVLWAGVFRVIPLFSG